MQGDPNAPSDEAIVAPGVRIVRSNTPRPISFSQNSSFPVEAPTAPPLPEESGERNDNANEQLKQTPLPISRLPKAAESEFTWLFEYGPEMDAAYLNNAERLAGAAMLYGPGVLRGYSLAFDVLNARGGQVVVTIVPSRRHDDEVWGILYRVPARALQAQENAPPLLDRMHSAAQPDGLFERIEVTVHEAYRERDIACVTYIASTIARNEYHLLPRQSQTIDSDYLQRLVEAAQKQKLPESYVEELSRSGGSAPTETQQQNIEAWSGHFREHNTEPLPAIVPPTRAVAPSQQRGAEQTSWRRGGIIFAAYMACALAAALLAALIQGSTIGSGLLAASFIPPGIPWFILVYGFMGGCLSGIVTLGRYQAAFPPNFVLIVWFTRPFIGAVLAVIAYLFLNSGLLALSGSAIQHNALFSLLAVLAGSCEGWLFRRT